MKSNFILHAISNYMLSNCQDNQNPSGISNVFRESLIQYSPFTTVKYY